MARAAGITPHDTELARAAAKKQLAGRRLTVRESTALRKVSRAKEEQDRERLCRELPKKLYLQLAGITAAKADKHAAEFAVPCRGRTVDLAAVLAWLHATLHEKGERILRDDPLDVATEKLRREKARLAEIQRQEAERQLLPRDEVHAAFSEIAGIFRSATMTLAKDWPDAADTLTEAIDDALKHPFFNTPADAAAE